MSGTFVDLSLIRTDGGTQPRTAINESTVQEYAEQMAQGVVFPPVTIFFDGVDHWLADGFHRLHAARSARLDGIAATVTSGTRRDAVLYSVGANQAHGLKRTNADKRKAVLTLLEDDEWRQWNKSEIARQCGVSTELVLALSRSHMPETASDNEKKFTTKHGTVSTMHTENIGRRNVSMAERAERIQALVEGGHSMKQIVADTGIGTPRINAIARAKGIDLSRARLTQGLRRHDSDRILEHVVMDAENLTADVGLIDFAALDRARLAGWIDSLVQSRRALDAFIRQLTKERTSHGETA